MRISKLKSDVKDWAYQYIDKIAVYNNSFKNFIEINKTGIDHTLNAKKLTEAHLLSVYSLKDILYRATYKGSEIPKHAQLNVIKIHIFETVKIIKGVKYKVHIVVREVAVDANKKNRHFFYDHYIMEKA